MTDKTTITLLRGDGIGPEVVDATVLVLKAMDLPFAWDEHELGAATEGALPDSVLASIKRNGLALKGPTDTPSGSGHVSLNVRLRQELKLFANVRPVQSIPGVATRYSGTKVDLVIYRENIEGHYSGKEHRDGDTATGTAVYTVANCERFANYAFEDAIRRGRHKMTIVHKANILKQTHGLFLEVAREAAEGFKNRLEVTELITDAFFDRLIQRPDELDCLLLTNLDGDYASDAAAALVGGLGVVPGANIGARAAVFEAVHGTAPDIAGQGKANPTSLMLSAALMLDHLGGSDKADLLRRSIYAVIGEGRHVTADVRPDIAASTIEFAEAVAMRVKS